MQIKEIVKFLDERYPRENASDFDQNVIGFTVGLKETKVNKVLLALDLTEEVLEEAKEVGANFIITHHPFLFNPITKVLFDEPKGKIIKEMCISNISTYSMHTNLDVAIGGVNDTLADILGIEYEHTEALKNDFLRYGKIKETTLSDLVKLVKSKFDLSGVRVIGDLNTVIKSVGVLGGSGGSFSDINVALRANVDCYITGEVHLANAIYAKQMNLCMIEVNHGVERFVLDSLKTVLEKEFGDIFVISKINTDPFITY